MLLNLNRPLTGGTAETFKNIIFKSFILLLFYVLTVSQINIIR